MTTKQFTNAIKKYLNNNEYLEYIQHNKDDKQFICDGYSIVLFNNYNELLDNFNQKKYSTSINYEYLQSNRINVKKWYKLPKTYNKVFKNINKYIKTYDLDTILIDDKAFFRCDLIKIIYNIAKYYGDFDINIGKEINSNDYILQLKNDDVKIELLPCVFSKKCDTKEYKQSINDFINSINK